MTAPGRADSDELNAETAIDMAEMYAAEVVTAKLKGAVYNPHEMTLMFAALSQAHALIRIVACLEQITGRTSNEE